MLGLLARALSPFGTIKANTLGVRRTDGERLLDVRDSIICLADIDSPDGFMVRVCCNSSLVLKLLKRLVKRLIATTCDTSDSRRVERRPFLKVAWKNVVEF